MPPPVVILCHLSSASRSFVLAALRALHLDPSLAGGKLRDDEEESITAHRVRGVTISRVGPQLRARTPRAFIPR